MPSRRQYPAGDGPVLLRLERGVGHSSRAASRHVALPTDYLAFLGMHAGLTAPGNAT